MPYGRNRKVYSRPNRHGRRAAMAKRIQRAYRRRRFRNNLRRRAAHRRRRPTLRGVAAGVRKLFKRDDKKFYYRKASNVLVTGHDITGAGIFPFIQDLTTIPYNNISAAGGGPMDDPNTGAPYSASLCREPDSLSANIKNIRIHATMHVTHPEATKVQKCLLMLVKTRNGIGSVDGITMPKIQEIYDGYSGFPTTAEPAGDVTATSLLAPWECFRNTGPGGYGARYLNPNVFKILWKKTCWLSPQNGHVDMQWRTTGGPLPTATSSTTPQYFPTPAQDGNQTYNSNRVSSVSVVHTHNCMDAKIEFTSNGSDDSVNVKYFLVALAGGLDPVQGPLEGFRLNSVCKINYRDE